MVMNTQPQPKRVGESAVVIGASMAGLCAACVLADRFDHVTVLDHDHLPEHSTWRQQVPQGRHPHLLLAAGARLLEDWCPGIIDELYAGGAVELDLTADLYWHQGGGVARRPTSSLKGPSMSRPFLEWTIRQRLASHPAITIRGDTAVEGLELDPTRTRVVAVRLEGGDPVPCDLVVDATGRQARSLSWLAALGYPEPKVARVEVDTRYLTQELRRTELPQARLEDGRRHRRTRPPNASPWPCPSRATAGWSSSAASTARRPPPTTASVSPTPRRSPRP